jgi:predicted small integral membrane protein
MKQKSEIRMPKSERNPKLEDRKHPRSGYSNFGFRSSFGFRISVLGFLPFLVAGCLLLSSVSRAEEFADISVTPNAIYTGNTFHGYAEMRVVLENESSKTHVVTLVYPNNVSGNYGNCISRLSRTVTLAPAAREVVSLLQPPLPAQGDGSIRVEVDGRHEGEVRAPNANNHCNYYSRGGQIATVFISRSLDYDAVAHVFQANSGSFTAAQAVGPPDAHSMGGWDPNSWMPDTRSYGRTNWLELDYATPQIVSKISVYYTQLPGTLGFISLLGSSGTNLANVPLASGSSIYTGPTVPHPRLSHPGSGWTMNYSLPPTSQPVKTVRLNFGTTPPTTIAVDAVEISGPTGSQWASDAHASSDNSASTPRYRPGGTGDEVQSIRAESPVSEWSENWLAYSPFDAVVINGADFAALPPGVLAALGDYVQAGGNMVLLGKGDLPAVWHSVQTKKLHDGTEFQTGFGSVFAFGAESPSALDVTTVERLRETVRDTVRYFQGLPDESGAANAAMPVVESLKIPTRGIVIIMLVFVMTIGPVNMIYLNRIKRRTWMLWTIPAISFATTLLVFAYSLLREGITPNTRIAGITVLDQTSHQAATIGGEAFYCPLTPSGGLHFDFNTEATPLVSVGYGSGTAREVDWTQSQHFQHGWVSARVPEHFHLRKSETRRERIQVLKENGRLQIVNSLGAPIKSLWLADKDMNVYWATSVAAGEKGGLMLSKRAPSREKLGVNGLLRDLTFTARSDSLDENAGRYLVPNTYIAVLDGNPFIENALGSAASPKRTRSSCVVFGIIETEDK